MDLNEAREQIWTIDEEMATLFVQRMEAAKAVAAYKKEYGLAIEDKDQEAAKIAAHAALIADDALRPFYLQFLENTMGVSKLWQQQIIEGDDETLANHDETAAR